MKKRKALSPMYLSLGGRLLVASHSIHVKGVLHLHLGSIRPEIILPNCVGRARSAGGDWLNLRSSTLTIQHEPIEEGLLFRPIEIKDVSGHNIVTSFLPGPELDWPWPFADIPSAPLRSSRLLQDAGIVGAVMANRWHHEAGLKLMGVILAHPLQADVELKS